MKNATAYIGPTIEHIVQTGAVFKGGYPPKLADLLEKEPFLTELLVPIEKLAESKKIIRIQDSNLNLLYRKAGTIGGK